MYAAAVRVESCANAGSSVHRSVAVGFVRVRDIMFHLQLSSHTLYLRALCVRAHAVVLLLPTSSFSLAGLRFLEEHLNFEPHVFVL